MKPKIKPKATKPAPVVPTKPDFAGLGMAVALADLAAERGVHVADLTSEAMTAAGLPPKVDHWIGRLAHDIDRNKVDALLFRIKWNPMHNGSHVTGTDGATMAEAKKIEAEVEARNREKQRLEAAERQRTAQRNNEKRTETLTKRERRAIEQKEIAAVEPVAPDESAVDL